MNRTEKLQIFQTVILTWGICSDSSILPYTIDIVTRQNLVMTDKYDDLYRRIFQRKFWNDICEPLSIDAIWCLMTPFDDEWKLNELAGTAAYVPILLIKLTRTYPNTAVEIVVFSFAVLRPFPPTGRLIFVTAKQWKRIGGSCTNTWWRRCLETQPPGTVWKAEIYKMCATQKVTSKEAESLKGFFSSIHSAARLDSQTLKKNLLRDQKLNCREQNRKWTKYPKEPRNGIAQEELYDVGFGSRSSMERNKFSSRAVQRCLCARNGSFISSLTGSTICFL